MNTRALKYLAGRPAEGPFRCALPRNRAQDLEKVPKPSQSAIYLVDNADLAGFRTMTDLVVDRGFKNVHKGLKTYLTGCPAGKIPLVEGVYRSTGQLQRSVGDFLKNTGSRIPHFRAIVGVPPDLFDNLWTMARTDPADGETAVPTTAAPEPGASPPGTPGSDADAAGDGSLIQLIGYHAEARVLDSKFVGQSVDAELVRQLIVQAARAECSVLIVGDTGTGKNIVAQEIHSLSRRGKHRFVPVNCSALPLNLLESELFGFKKGAFTDAYADRIGLWEAANHGTIFLDEVAELPVPHQAKILRVLDDKAILPLGAREPVQLDVRVLAATNRDLFGMVQRGEFREDLYYRLRGMLIRTPALRRHLDDVPRLAQHFWQRITRNPSAALPDDILSELRGYAWPGNVRELLMVLSSLYAMFGDRPLTVQHLRAIFKLDGQQEAKEPPPADEREFSLHRAECLRHLRRTQEVLQAVRVVLQPVIAQRNPPVDAVERLRADMLLRSNEVDILCTRPLLFHSEIVFNTIHGLKGKAAYFLGVLADDAARAVQYARTVLKPELELAGSAVFKEVERLLDKM